jgi:hypothetical protein
MKKFLKKLKRQKINKEKCQGRDKIKTLPKEKNKCPLFLILIHWIFKIIEYNLLCILM